MSTKFNRKEGDGNYGQIIPQLFPSPPSHSQNINDYQTPNGSKINLFHIVLSMNPNFIYMYYDQLFFNLAFLRYHPKLYTLSMQHLRNLTKTFVVSNIPDIFCVF